MDSESLTSPKNFGFISTRFSGTDGVSLEAEKWAQILRRNGHSNYWFAGKLDKDPQHSFLVPQAYFEHSENRWINAQLLGKHHRSRECTRRICALKEELKDKLYEFVDTYHIDVLVAQNCLTLPMHIPLGLALTEVIAESGIPSIAHHHDFYWERDRYVINAAQDYLQTAFPARLMNLRHVVINSAAREQLAYRVGISSMAIPNVLDFTVPPPASDEYALSFREDIGVRPDDILILQPTRLVSRKGVEHAIELVRRLQDPKYKLIVSHEAGDEGLEYQDFLLDYAKSVGVDMRIVAHRIAPWRSVDTQQEKLYSLGDVYQHADLVSYPSLYEGFGNAFLEAVYFRKPLLMNRYSIFIRDIEPKGFQVVGMNGYLTWAVVEDVRRVLEDSAVREAMVEKNFELGKKYFSYEVLERRLGYLLSTIFGVDSP